MKVLLVAEQNDRSEIAMFKAIAQSGIEIDVICDEESHLCDEIRPHAASLTTHRLSSRLNFRAIRIIREKLSTKPYDIVHALTNRALSTSLLASMGKRLSIVGYRGTIGHISRFSPECWITYLNPRVTRIITLSNAVRRYLLSFGLPEERLVTIYKGQDPAWYAGLHKPDFAAFGIPKGAFVAGFTGRIRPVKGVDVLIQSAMSLPRDSNIHFLIVGELCDNRVKRLAEDPLARMRVHLTGYRKDAAAIAGACDVFVMPSTAREGLCRSVGEAMAQGVPAIVSDVGGMPELVSNGESGIVVPPRDPAALSRAIVSLAEDSARRQDMGRKAKQRIECEFNMATMIAKTIALYKTLGHYQ